MVPMRKCTIINFASELGESFFAIHCCCQDSILLYLSILFVWQVCRWALGS